jgi:hypothetical protein
MSAVVEAPVDLVEAVAALRLPPKTDQRLEDLMDRNTNGMLAPHEKEQLKDLVELSETLSLMRGNALQLLGRHPR